MGAAKNRGTREERVAQAIRKIEMEEEKKKMMKTLDLLNFLDPPKPLWGIEYKRHSKSYVPMLGVALMMAMAGVGMDTPKYKISGLNTRKRR
jgi:hypothetical protein